MTDPRLLDAISEKEWLGWVTTYARLQGYSAYHTHDARHSEAGFPDLILAHPNGDFLAVELKSTKGKVTDAQRRWLALFAAASIDNYVWRPSDQDEVIARLDAHSRTSPSVVPSAPWSMNPDTGGALSPSVLTVPENRNVAPSENRVE